VGNGPSDVLPAEHAHHIFAREDMLDLCKQKGLKCLPFVDFNDILKDLKRLKDEAII
jgi:2-hydroxy-3-keto-5-methylthiopentenyl-1-phosphate phosphatase